MVVGGLRVVLRRQQLLEGALLLGVRLEGQNHALHVLVGGYSTDVVPQAGHGMPVACKGDAVLVIDESGDAVARTRGEKALCRKLTGSCDAETEHGARQDKPNRQASTVHGKTSVLCRQ